MDSKALDDTTTENDEGTTLDLHFAPRVAARLRSKGLHLMKSFVALCGVSLRQRKPKTSFPLFAFRRRGGGRSRTKKCKEVFGFARASPRARLRRVPAQSERTKKSQATTHAERAKSVRVFAKVGSGGVQ